MATPSDAVWEVRKTVGSINNGGGYSASLAAGTGVDYSQQPSPQLTHADGVGNGTTTFTSAAGGFTALMLGNCMHINGHGDFFIMAVGTSTSVTLDSSPGTFTGATYAVGGCKTIATSFAVDVVNIAGNKIWVRGDGIYSQSLTPAAAGTGFAPVTLEGYTTTRGDGGRATIKCTGPLVLGAFTTAKHLVLDGNGAATIPVLVNGGNGGILYDCVIQNANQSLLVVSTGVTTVDRCLIQSGLGSGDYVTLNADTIFRDTKIIGSGSAGAGLVVNGGNDHQFERCVFAGSNFEAVYIPAGASGLVASFNGCAFFHNGRDGLRNYSGSLIGAMTVRNCIFGRNAGVDIGYTNAGNIDYSANASALEWANVALQNNYFYTTGTGRYFHHPASSSDVTLLGDPFVDSTGTLNYELNNTAGVMVSGSPMVVTWADGVNVGKFVGGPMGTNAQAALTGAFNQAAPLIDETLFPIQISRGMTGGPTYSTVVTVTGGGSEQRIALWARPRYRWEINNSPKQPSEMQDIINFFHAREGRLRGFRFQDWSDFTVTNEPLAPTGASTIQLIKTYTNGPSATVRNIYKPKATPTVTLLRNGAAYVTFSLDTTTGLISPTADSTATITAITKATAALVTTSAPHGFTVGQTLSFSGVVGMTQINGLTGVVTTTPLTTTLTVAINSTSFSTYVSGGTASKFIQPTETLTWTGQFDTPVRFDVDELHVSYDDPTSWSLDGLPIVEIRP